MTNTTVLADNALFESAVRGALDTESTGTGLRFSRLPRWTRDQFGENWPLHFVAGQSSGMRLEFDTEATWIELEATFARISMESAGIPLSPAVLSVTSGAVAQDYSFDEGDVWQVEADWTYKLVRGNRTLARFNLPPHVGKRNVSLWLPHNCSVELRGIRSDRPLSPGVNSARRWIHYGSSISQASEAATPLGVWPVIAARKLGLDLLNLGLAGNAMMDQFVARTIRDQPADLITLKLGINVVNSAAYRTRTFTPVVHGFLDTIREGHSETPIVLTSPIHCPVHEDAPGPTIFERGKARASDIPRTPHDGQLTLSDIRSALEAVRDIRSKSDPNLYFLDGTRLLGADDSEHLPDCLHPDNEGYAMMGERFASIASSALWLPTH
ncbi:SGNH/GDSL hydrolase family protein [Paenarthrobacter nicotinovorans]|uniref:SGNH/GDSL hydrolase family protein n=1 Tax=Paenarthrobacter nicotinovorans TaxID=29320 RepID=UPI00374A19A5